MTLWRRSLGRSNDKPTPLYLHYQSAWWTWWCLPRWNQGATEATWSHRSLWLRHLARSRDKLRSLYLCYNSAYGHQTWQNGDTIWMLSSHKNQQNFDHVTWKSAYGNQAWQDDDLSRWARKFKVTWPFDHVTCDVTWQNKTITCLMPQC